MHREHHTSSSSVSLHPGARVSLFTTQAGGEAHRSRVGRNSVSTLEACPPRHEQDPPMPEKKHRGSVDVELDVSQLRRGSGTAMLGKAPLSRRIPLPRRNRTTLILLSLASLSALVFYLSSHVRRRPPPLESLAPRQPVSRKECNPFTEEGFIHNDPDPGKVYWKPVEPTCAPSRYFTDFFRPEELPSDSLHHHHPQRPHLPSWLVARNHTILLLGDSLERWHLYDFQDMASNRNGGNFETTIEAITPGHPASAGPYITPGTDEATRKRETDMFMNARIMYRPWVARVELRSNVYLTLINVFAYGLEDLHGLYNNETFYFPPAKMEDRIDAHVLPLLPNLARHFNQPDLHHPDVIEVQSGIWDLRRWSSEDFASHAVVPSKDEMSIVFTDLSEERLNSYRATQYALLHRLAAAFPASSAHRRAPPIIWRSMNFSPEQHYWAPWPRAGQLDTVARKGLRDIHASPKAEDRELSKRLRLNNWGRLVERAGKHYRDGLHPQANPAGVIWADIILYELEKAVKGT